MHDQDWVKMSCPLESKSSSAFNFKGAFALKIVQLQTKPHYKKWRNMWYHKPDVKDSEKRQHKWKPCGKYSFKCKNQRHNFIMKTLTSKFQM